MPFPATGRLEEKHVDKNSHIPQLAYETEIGGKCAYCELQWTGFTNIFLVKDFLHEVYKISVKWEIYLPTCLIQGNS